MTAIWRQAQLQSTSFYRHPEALCLLLGASAAFKIIVSLDSRSLTSIASFGPGS